MTDPSEDVLAEAADVVDGALAEAAVIENSDGRLLDLGTAQYIVYAEIGMVELVNDVGQTGIYTTLTVTHAPLDQLLNEDEWVTTTYVIGSIASLTLITQQLQSALGYAQDPTPIPNNQENN